MSEDNGTVAEKPAKRATKKAEPAEQIVILPIRPKIIELTIVGTTPLMVCAWSHKAKQQMRDKQMGAAKKGREPKVPHDDYLASLYTSTEGWTGIPAGGMKGCLVNSCRGLDLPMTVAKRMLFVRSQGVTAEGQQLVRVHGRHEMNESMVRIDNGGTADIRYRALYREWSITLEIEFLSDMISATQVANLVERAGFIEGLCEHRPGAPKSVTGNNGRFMIKRDE